MRQRLILLVIAALLGTASVRAGEVFVVDKGQSDVSFQVRHVTGPVAGAFTDFTGTVDYDPALPARSSVEFRIRTASITTNNEKRDAHLRSPDFFDADTYPEIVFTSTKIEPKGANAFEVRGRLTMRGVTRDIVLPVTRLVDPQDPRGPAHAAFQTAITLNRKDYNIIWNRALDTGGWVLADDVQVAIRLQATREVRDGNK